MKHFRILYICVSVGRIWAQKECSNNQLLGVGFAISGPEKALLYLVSCSHLLSNFMKISTAALHGAAVHL